MDEKTNLAYSWIDFEDIDKAKINLTDFDGITNLISTCSPVNLGLFLVEYTKGKIKGSLRSEPYRGRDVVKIANTTASMEPLLINKPADSDEQD